MIDSIITSAVIGLGGAIVVGTSIILAVGGAASAPQNTATVVAWIDGDTVNTREQGEVRLIGIDTPDVRKCPDYSARARANAEALAPAGSTIILADPESVRDRDKYNRALRYVEVPGETVVDVGTEQIAADLADARYDSQDGYDPHPQEGAYRAADNPGSVNDKGTSVAACLMFGNDEDEYSDGDDDQDLPDNKENRASAAIYTAAYLAIKKDPTKEARQQAWDETYPIGCASPKLGSKALHEACIDARGNYFREDNRQRKAQSKAEWEEWERSQPPSPTPGSSGGSSNDGSPRYYAPGGDTYVGG